MVAAVRRVGASDCLKILGCVEPRLPKEISGQSLAISEPDRLRAGWCCCRYADMFNIVTTIPSYQPPAYYQDSIGGVTDPPRMQPSYSATLNSPAACQALCAAQDGCDFFTYVYLRVDDGSYQHKCYMKGGFEDSHCHEYTPFTQDDPLGENWSGPAVCPGGAGWKLMFRQTYPHTYHKSANALMHNERDPSAPDYSILAQLEDWRGADGFFKLKMTWPRHCDSVPGDPNCETSNVWTQSSNFWHNWGTLHNPG